MVQEMSCGDTPSNTREHGTEELIQKAFQTTVERKITRNTAFLDDEKLPESERIRVLDEVFHRNIRSRQIERLARYVSPALAGTLPPNLLIYGPSGTGKSVTCLHFLSTFSRMCNSRGQAFRFLYVDLTTPRTCFGALNELAIAADDSTRRYRKGIALEHMQENIVAALSRLAGTTCIIIDEVDNVTVDADTFYTFLAKTLPKRVQTRLFYIFLTNRIDWDRSLDPRILAVLMKTDMIFEPYYATDLVRILELRVEKALDQEKVEEGAIRKIAAYASRENGDARKAVDLLVKAVKIAEESSGHLGQDEVDAADQLLEVDKTSEVIRALAPQQKLALTGCTIGIRKERGRLTTGQAYRYYCGLCSAKGTRSLTQRRFSDMLSFLDLYGLVNARVISKGRYGQTRELSQSLPEPLVQDLLRDPSW